MKLFNRIAVRMTVIAILLLQGYQETYACDRSSVVLDSIVAVPGAMTIYLTSCIGGGVSGTSFGAGGDTRNIAFGFYAADGPITISSYTPSSITGDFSGCTMLGSDFGPLEFPFFSQATIGFSDPGCANAYQCVSTTAICGEPHEQCTQYSFTVATMPDSIRLFGVEGGGNPEAGCYGNTDMLVDLTSLPVVWGGFSGNVKDAGIDLSWTTLSEVNNDRFVVERAGSNGHFEAIAVIQPGSAGQQMQHYSFMDVNPLRRLNQYRIVQVDIGGGQDQSEIISFDYAASEGINFLSLGPNPVQNRTSMRFSSDRERDLMLQVFDAQGKVHFNQVYQLSVGESEVSVDLERFTSGVYFFRMQSEGEVFTSRVLKE